MTRMQAKSAGFALPLALMGGFGLLLGSLALQSVGLAARQQTAVMLRLRQAEDRLASAAHRLVDTISRRHGCLLALPLASWPTAGSACAGPADLVQLLDSQGPEGRLRLIDWQPGPPGAGGELEAELLLEAEAPAGSVPLGDPPRRAAFALNLLGQPPRAVDLRGLGLRGVTP